MGNAILLTALLISLVGCKKAVNQFTNNSIVGKWKLSEYLADPGNGTGSWQSTNSSNTSYLEFKQYGELIATPYDIYSWDHYQVTSDSTIIFIRASEKFNWRYHFSTNLLSLYGSCLESCGEKYIPAR